jgi:DNA-binding GntR family transcriptional regulator
LSEIRKPGAKRRTDEEVTEALRIDIVSGAYTPRERLPEVELATRYSASRASVRSALMELEREGLVERRPNRGAQVRAISLEEAIEITEVRMVLEGLCAAKAAELATAADRKVLHALMEDMKAAVKAKDSISYAQLNRRLHAQVREIARQETATRIIALLRNQFVQHQFRLSMIPGRPETSVHEHDRIAKAIIAGDPVEAEAAMRAHLQSVKAMVISSHELAQEAIRAG